MEMEMSSKSNGKGRSSEAKQQLEGQRQESGRSTATVQWLRRCCASGATQLEAEEAGGLGRDVRVSSKHGQKDEDALGDLGAGRVDCGGEAGVDFGRARLWIWDNKKAC